jgi:site-specific DNA recombinase
MRGAVADYERTGIADRMRRGRLAASPAGRLLPWGTAPYGYRLAPAGGRIEEEEATLVGEIFGWYAEQGLTSYKVAQRLRARGVPTAHGHAVWTTAAVRRSLGDAPYSGLADGNRERAVPARRLQPILGEPAGAGGGGVGRRAGAGDHLDRAVRAGAGAPGASSRLRRAPQPARLAAALPGQLRPLRACPL